MTRTVEPIRTERLLLRAMALDDLDAYARLFADPEVVRFIGDGTTADTADTAGWLSRSLDRNDHEGFDRRSVVLAEDGSLIGWCGIAVWDVEGAIERELGYVLARDQWGRGYATEAGAAMRDHARSAPGVKRLIALIHRDNEASKRVARKLGMAYERDAEFHGRMVELFALEALSRRSRVAGPEPPAPLVRG